MLIELAARALCIRDSCSGLAEDGAPCSLYHYDDAKAALTAAQVPQMLEVVAAARKRHAEAGQRGTCNCRERNCPIRAALAALDPS